MRRFSTFMYAILLSSPVFGEGMDLPSTDRFEGERADNILSRAATAELEFVSDDEDTVLMPREGSKAEGESSSSGEFENEEDARRSAFSSSRPLSAALNRSEYRSFTMQTKSTKELAKLDPLLASETAWLRRQHRDPMNMADLMSDRSEPVDMSRPQSFRIGTRLMVELPTEAISASDSNSDEQLGDLASYAQTLLRSESLPSLVEEEEALRQHRRLAGLKIEVPEDGMSVDSSWEDMPPAPRHAGLEPMRALARFGREMESMLFDEDNDERSLDLAHIAESSTSSVRELEIEADAVV